jgi:hypothetical protein
MDFEVSFVPHSHIEVSYQHYDIVYDTTECNQKLFREFDGALQFAGVEDETNLYALVGRLRSPPKGFFPGSVSLTISYPPTSSL